MTNTSAEKNAVVLDEEVLEEIAGGPAYIKFDGIDGESRVMMTKKVMAGQGRSRR